MNKNYRIRYWNGFYYLQERCKFLFIPYWVTISADYTIERITEIYKNLQQLNDEQNKC
jgi:hypothetical protein